MTIAVRNMEVEQELPPVRKEMTFDDMRLFSMWGNRNIHTDWEVAKKGGLPAPIAAGLMSHAYLSEMLTNFFGGNWHSLFYSILCPEMSLRREAE